MVTSEATLTKSGLRPLQQHQRPTFFINIATVFGGQAASVAVALVTEICFARILGPVARGQISLCTMAIYLGTLVGGLGVDIPIVIWVANRKRLAHWLSAVLLWGMIGCAGAIFLWQIAYSRWHASLLRGVTPALSLVVPLTIPVTVLFGYLIAFLTGAERFRARAGVGVVKGIAGLLGFLAVALASSRSADAAMWGNLAGVLIGLAAGAFLMRRWTSEETPSGTDGNDPNEQGKPWAEGTLRTGLLAGLRGQIGNVAAFFNYRLDVFIVNYFLDPAQVGLYAIGVAASEALWQIPQAAATALFPRTARTLDEGASEFTCLVLRQVLLLSCVSGALFALVSPFAVPLVFGARFRPSVPVIWWILPGTIALAAAKVASSDLAGRHKTGYASAFGILALVVTVVLDLWLIPRLGIQGAAMASSAAYLVNAGGLLLAMKHELGVNWKKLLVPSWNELKQYRRAWTNLVAWWRTGDRMTK